MNLRKHLILLIVTFFCWTGFYLLGLPFNYFVDWNLAEKILLSLVTAFAIVPYIAFFTLLFLGKAYFKTSIWFAFYASVLIFILDFIVIGLVEGIGIHFVISHWVLTLGYFYVWISIPLVGFALKKLSEKQNPTKNTGDYLQNSHNKANSADAKKPRR
jgi:Na+/melibiose symporter-like transporter